MKIAVNFEKKYAFMIFGTILILASIFAVYAYNSGKSPNVLGHSAEELEGVCKSDGTNCPLSLNSEISGIALPFLISGVQNGGGAILYNFTGAYFCSTFNALIPNSAIQCTKIITDPISGVALPQFYSGVQNGGGAILYGKNGAYYCGSFSGYPYAVPTCTKFRTNAVLSIGLPPFIGSVQNGGGAILYEQSGAYYCGSFSGYPYVVPSCYKIL